MVTQSLNSKDLHNERELQTLLAEGDVNAFNVLVDHYYQPVYQIVLGYIKIVQSAEDVTQDIFFKLWKDREKLSSIESLKAYIFILSRNAVLDAMRKKGPRFPVGDYLENSVAATAYSPEEGLMYQQLSSTIQEAIQLLPPQQKRAFLLSREQGMTHDQIAKQMNLSKNTIKNHLVAALNFIRNHVFPHGNMVLWWWLGSLIFI